MKKNIFLPAFLLSLLTFGYAHAESIVMKNTVYGLEALSDEDIQTHGQVVSDILLKYCWPMCQDSDLTAEEQQELLSPEGNEERFLEKKLNETIPLSRRDFEFAVVFVPTTLYEMFCTIQTTQIEEITEENCPINIDPVCIEVSYLSTESDPKRLHRYIKKSNPIFYPKYVLTFHQLFIAFLICAFPENDISSSARLSDIIQHNTATLLKELETIRNKEIIHLRACKEISELEGMNRLSEKTKNNQNARLISKYRPSIRRLSLDSNTETLKPILNYIELEYKAHQLNKALISRSSRKIFEKNKEGLIASTIRSFTSPYSMSFGTSLFAGYLHDSSACVYYYIRLDIAFGRNIGFALYIDKEKYYLNKIEQLFFIPALSSLTGLFAEGEFFHSRSKAAIRNSSIKLLKIIGISLPNEGKLFDEAQVLTVERDSLEHELKFLKYFIDNFEIFALPAELHLPADETLTPEEQQAEILHAQCEAFVETYALIKERQEQLARVLDAIAEVAAKEKDQKNENFGALLASTPETADLVAEDRAQQRIATLARHLAPAAQDLASAKL